MTKFKLLAAVLALALAGCTSTNVKSDTFSIKRTSVFQRVDIAEASANPDGTFKLKGYKNDGGNEALANALVAALQMMQMMQASQGVPMGMPAQPAARSAPAVPLNRSHRHEPAPPDPFVVVPVVPNNSAP